MTAAAEKEYKVLHVLFHSLPFRSDGYAIRSHYILKTQRKLGLHIWGVTGLRDASRGREEAVDRVTYYRSPIPDGLIWPAMNLSNAGGGIFLRHYLKKGLHALVDVLQPDIIHAHTPWHVGRPAMEVARERGIRFVYEVRGLWEESLSEERSVLCRLRAQRMRRNEDHVIRRADRVVAISEGLKREVVSRGLIGADKIAVVPNGVDLDKFTPTPGDPALIGRLGLSGKVVVGYVSSLRRMEGLSCLIEAMKSVRDRASLVIVGDGPEKTKLEKLAESLGLSRRVIFTGRVPHENVLDYYAMIDLFVVPRINAKVCHIVTPLKPLEAMAMGRCVLASRVGGLAEMISEGKTGVMFDPENVGDLAEKLNGLVENEGYRKQLGENALKFVREERSWDVLCRRYLEVYSPWIDRKRSEW